MGGVGTEVTCDAGRTGAGCRAASAAGWPKQAQRAPPARATRGPECQLARRVRMLLDRFWPGDEVTLSCPPPTSSIAPGRKTAVRRQLACPSCDIVANASCRNSSTDNTPPHAGRPASILAARASKSFLPAGCASNLFVDEPCAATARFTLQDFKPLLSAESETGTLFGWLMPGTAIFALVSGLVTSIAS